MVKRRSNFELLRVIAIVFIILYHFVFYQKDIFSVITTNSVINILYSLFYAGGKIGVALFIMITGYFMIDKEITLKKLIKLELQVLFYSLGIYLVFLLFGGYSFSFENLFKSMMPLFNNLYWFYTRYFSIIVFTPYINKMLNNLSKKEYLKMLGLGFIFLIFLLNVNFEMSRNALYLLYYYTIGGFIKRYGDDYKKYDKFYLVVFILGFVLIVSSILFFKGINASDYFVYYFMSLGSFLTVISACSLFIWFNYRKIKYSKLINRLGNVCFGTYLFQEHFVMIELLWGKLFKISNASNWLDIVLKGIVAIIFIFLITYIIELVRNYLFNKIFDKENYIV